MKKVSGTTTVMNANGFHVRPSTAIASVALKYKCRITFFKNNDMTHPIDGKSSLDLISAFIVLRDSITVECEGDDAEAALATMLDMVHAVYELADAKPVIKH